MYRIKADCEMWKNWIWRSIVTDIAQQYTSEVYITGKYLKKTQSIHDFGRFSGMFQTETPIIFKRLLFSTMFASQQTEILRIDIPSHRISSDVPSYLPSKWRLMRFPSLDKEAIIRAAFSHNGRIKERRHQTFDNDTPNVPNDGNVTINTSENSTTCETAVAVSC